MENIAYYIPLFGILALIYTLFRDVLGIFRVNGSRFDTNDTFMISLMCRLV